MSTKDPNMKVIIGADTKDFDKGAKDVKQGLKDLSKTGDQAISSLGDAFGVNTGKVNQMVSAVRGLGARMTEASSTGVKAFGQLLGSITPLGGAIAGLGLTAAVAGFKALKAEADNFKSTIDGMNLSMATSAYISTYQQVLHDVNSETGKSVATAMSEWEKGLARFRSNISSAFVSAVGGESKWYDAFLPTGLIRGWGAVSENIDRATESAERAEKLGNQMAELKKRELAIQGEIAQAELDIAKARREASDKTKSAAERAEAEARYREKINESYDKQVQLAKAMAIVQNEIDGLAANGYEDTKNTLELNNRILALETEREGKLQSIDKLSANIAKSTSAAAAAAQKMAEAQAKWAGLGTVSTAGLNPGTPGISGPAMSILPRQEDVQLFKETLMAQLGDITIGIGVKADTEQIHDITNEVTSLLESGVARTGEIIGNLVGTLAGGGDAWGDFKSAALAAFGDMAIAVGKIAISMGVAAAGIDVALKDTGQWYIAVAAGAALVALGAAVKSSLSSVASGDYSAGGGGYSGGYSSAGSNGGGYETRDVKVYLTGTLEADGDKLITVINNTNNRNYYTK